MPSRETVWFVPLIIVGLIVGSALTAFTPIFGIPILIVVALCFFGVQFAARASSTGRAAQLRRQARQDVEFTDDDRRTLTPSSAEPSARR
jgi:uncharacterized membrane protein YfcA